MTCQELADFICDYIEGDLPEEERRIFQVHLEMCPSCIAYLGSIESTCKLVGRESSEPLEDVPEALVQAILKARGEATGD
jgi:predicted anti-sigma-YlaC factor YlaD